MASSKITELTAANTIAVTDVLPFVSDPSGSPATKKITANNLANSILANVQVTILPNANVTYNLGSSAKAWNNVYLKTLYANGSAGSNGYILASNGSSTYWSNSSVFTTNVSAQYTWTNNHTFSGTVTFSSNVVYPDSTTQSTAFQKVAVPANSSATGTVNQIAWDSNSIYICVGTNTWKKVNLSSY